MDNTQVLNAIIERLNVSGRLASFDFDEVQEWEDGLLKSFIRLRILAKAVDLQSLECTGCENQCFMPVYRSSEAQRAFIVCDNPDKQNEMGRLNVPLRRLGQWQGNFKQMARVVAKLLELEGEPVFQKISNSYKLGMIKSDKGRRWAILNIQPLTLDINQNNIPLEDIIFFDKGELKIDNLSINDLLQSAPQKIGKVYKPNVDKRELRKSKTQTMYQNWQDEYKKLKLKNPNKSDTWLSVKLSKLPIAEGRDSETIRKKLNN